MSMHCKAVLHICTLMLFALGSALPVQAESAEPADTITGPEAGGPRAWQVKEISDGLQLREQPSVFASSLTTLSSGDILVNLGCQRAGRRMWCDVQPLHGGPRGYAAAGYLQPAKGPDGTVPYGMDDSALRAGQGEFDASGTLPCSQHRGQPMTACAFGVARAGGGYATVVVTRPDGSRRALFFSLGRPVSADTSEAGGMGEFKAEKEQDLHRIRVGEERYEVPDAVVLGG